MSELHGYKVPSVKSSISKREHEKYTVEEIDGAPGVVLPPFKLISPNKPGNFYYGVRIITGDQAEAGTSDSGVYIALIGTGGKTGNIHVMKKFSGACRRGMCDDLLINIDDDHDLGNILVVTVGNEKGKTHWFVNAVIVYNFQSDPTQVQQFPCYHWIGDGSVSITAHTTTEKDVIDNPILLFQRQEQVTKRQKVYKWLKFPESGVPSGIDSSVPTLPADEQFGLVKHIDFTGDAVNSAVSLGFQSVVVSVEGLFQSAKSVDDYNEYKVFAENLQVRNTPVYEAGRWTSDVEFGRQMLNGTNPVVIKRCTALPPNFHVTNDMVKKLLVRGLTLEEEMKEGHVYICDLNIMDGLTPKKGYYFSAPICLLYVNLSEQLVPIAIQLKQGIREEEKDQPNPVFLPTDHWIDWLLAKMHYQSANAQFHEISTHYISCHAAMEAYAVATMRNLPDPHPIFKLLVPHFRYTMAINARARATLINSGGIMDLAFGIGGEGKDELFSRVAKHYNIHWTNIKRSVKERGVDDPNLLPKYHYRDDGLKLWGALENFVDDIINEFYKTDEDVKGDTELQNWAADIHINGFPGFSGAKEGHGFPEHINTKEELKEHCTLIMFTGSVQHASINFNQYLYYGFVPNAPFGVRRPLDKKGEADYQTLLDTLPDKLSGIFGIAIVHTLSQYSENEIYLGHYPDERFTEEKAQRLIERCLKHLHGIAGDILERNKTLDMPYEVMVPGNIPNSITI